MKPTDPHKASAQGPAHGRHHHSPEEMHNEGVAHEHSDINIRAIILSVVAMFVIGAVVHVLMFGLFKLLDYRAVRNEPTVSPLARPATVMPPTTTGSPTFGAAASPQLLTNEPVALEQQRETERQLMQGYGWTDQAAGVAHIPIDEAKKLIVERGLPARKGPASAVDFGTARPARGESSSGRIVDGPPRGAGLPEIGAPQSAPPAAPAQHKPGGQ